ncbi:MAG: hypothetical protein JJ863_37815 [Deltaproteobacteria bacterium]|nr:hypothetical protein [Deltaproteobacteria bacterium]
MILGDPADVRSDVYGVGLVLDAMLAGRHAFERRSNSVQTFHDVLAGSAPRLDVHRLSLPATVADFVAAAMAREPTDRFRDATARREAIRPVLDAMREQASAPPPSIEQPIDGSLQPDRQRVS